MASSTGTSVCKACAANQVSKANSRACINCPSGRYPNPNLLSGQCFHCPTGKAGTFGLCYDCVANRFSSKKGRKSCETCPQGKRSTVGESICKSCDMGQIGLGRGAGCQDCPPGSYVTSVTATNCTVRKTTNPNVTPLGGFDAVVFCMFFSTIVMRGWSLQFHLALLSSVYLLPRWSLLDRKSARKIQYPINFFFLCVCRPLVPPP